MPAEKISWARTAVPVSLSFLLVSPLVMLALLSLKGLPAFASEHLGEVIVWSYDITWLPALGSGLLLCLVLRGIRPWLPFFVHPYDFGRCFSLGAITGGVSQAILMVLFRAVLGRPFSGFWTAGALMAGCISGAALAPIILKRLSRKRPA